MTSRFEGRYYKHQKDGKTICLIVGRADSGEFIQIIDNERVWQHDSLAGCRADTSGIWVDLPEIKGEVRYGPLMPLCSDIMGPFRFLPMQCRHSIVSMGHSLSGGFTVDGQQLDLTGGVGYIEGDRGRSFPKQYLWLHCNDFQEPCSIMASVADIPFLGFRFMGCICAIRYCGKEYRLATYHGVKIRCACKEKLILEQGPYRLEANISGRLLHPLKSPVQGRMIGTIHESNCTLARFRFSENGRMIFDLIGENTSFECNLTNTPLLIH